MLGSSKSWGLNSTQIHGTHVPVEEPQKRTCGGAPFSDPEVTGVDPGANENATTRAARTGPACTTFHVSVNQTRVCDHWIVLAGVPACLLWSRVMRGRAITGTLVEPNNPGAIDAADRKRSALMAAAQAGDRIAYEAPRSSIPTARTGRCPVRIRCHSAISGGEDGQAFADRRSSPLQDYPVGTFPDGRDRTDVRPGRLL